MINSKKSSIQTLNKEYEIVFEEFKSKAKIALKKGRFDNFIKHTEQASFITYKLNFKFSDNELDELIKKCAYGIIKKKYNFYGNANKVVFLDYFGWDNKGLTQQYLRALIKMDLDILVILQNFENHKSIEIQKEIRDFENVTIETFCPQLKSSEKLKQITKIISQFKPHCIIGHLFPSDVVGLGVLSLFPNVKKVNINITDHAFWLGYGIIDDNINFRPIGLELSKYYRGSNRVKNYIIPFYPITNSQDFLGFEFPIENNDIIIFSGGSTYKIIDDEFKYFDILKALLKLDVRIKILFAGEGNCDFLQKFINDNSFNDRIKILGNRNDITHIFERCDIYLSTYPITGGLMAQLASFYSKPILIFEDKHEIILSASEFLGLNKFKSDIIFDKIEDLLDYTKKLLNSKSFRSKEGEKLRSRLITEKEFNNHVEMYFSDKLSPYSDFHQLMPSDILNLRHKFFEIEKRSLETLRFIFSQIGFRLITTSPKLFFRFLKYVFSKFLIKQ